MKVISILTQHLNVDGRIVAESKTTYKKDKKPLVEKTSDLFELMDPKITDHGKYDDETIDRRLVTISTTKGKYVKTYSAKPFSLKAFEDSVAGLNKHDNNPGGR